MKDHCHYCNTTLYRMFMRQGVYSHVDDKEEYHNSDGKRICEACMNRLIPLDTELNCSNCDTPVYRLRNDHFRENTIRRVHLKGIAPQPDPYPNAYIRCAHCFEQIDQWE